MPRGLTRVTTLTRRDACCYERALNSAARILSIQRVYLFRQRSLSFAKGTMLGLPSRKARCSTKIAVPSTQTVSEEAGMEDLVLAGDPFDDASGQFRVQRFQPRIEGSFSRIE